jgi:hypothetical protein
MQKLVVLLGMFLTTTTLFGAYDVKIGVYKNGENLRHNIAKVGNTKYRKRIIVERKNRLYYAHAVLTSNADAKNALHAYKRVFKDAFISKNQVQVKNVAKKIKVPKKTEHINAKTLLENKTIYLCYEKGPKHLKDRVVQMVFSKEHVIYNPLKKMATPVEMPYEFKDNTLTLHLSEMKITHHIYKKASNFLYAQSMIDGLVVNKLRYYFDEKSALEYVAKH